jgi:hypothetical protein
MSPMSAPILEVELSVDPASVSERSQLDIRGAVRNRGALDIDTRIYASDLVVNGAPSRSWSRAIANGISDEREFALPPGERVQFRRLLPASSVLPGPGRYELVLSVHGVQSAPVTVEWQ